MPEISIFSSIKNVTDPENIDLLLYLEKTRDGEWEDIVTKCRTIADKKERDAFKRTMPTATLSGTFSQRNDGALVVHSGYLAMDLDEVEHLQDVKSLLEKDKYVFSVFMSTSGTGLRVLFKINPLEHRRSFLGISKYIYDKYGEVCDPNGVNPSKPYVVSFDPFLYMNFEDDVPLYTKYIKETVVKKIPDYVYTANDFDSIMKQIVDRGVNICEEYNDWLRAGLAISEQFGENGRHYFHEISRMSSKYRMITADKQYTACLKARGTNKVNISTFYFLAKQNGINVVSEQTRTIVRTTRTGKKAGLSKEKIIENLLKFQNISGADNVVNKVFESGSDSDEIEEESILPHLEMYISNNYNLRMNEVTGYLEQNGVVLTPADLNSIFVAAKKQLPKLDYQLMIRLLKSDFVEMYNPFYQFFGSDGSPVELPAVPVLNTTHIQSPLIDKLSQTIVNNNPKYTHFFLRKWVVSIISAAHKVHSPLQLCLLGKQNSGKTEFFRRLLPKELQPYYAESKLDKEKDDELLMTENLIIMDDELGGKSKQDALKLKNITSKQWFSLRRPYGDHNEKILRLAVLCGTSNINEILSDTTGNRRVIPVEVIDIDKELYNSIDKRELFMEAYRLYREGFDWRITHFDIPYLNNNQIEYEMIIKERELIEHYFFPGDDYKLTTTDILVDLEKLTGQRLNINTIGKELERLNFERKTVRDGKSTLKKWMVKKINRTGLGDVNGVAPF